MRLLLRRFARPFAVFLSSAIAVVFAATARADYWVSTEFEYNPMTGAVGALDDYSNSGTLLGSYSDASLLIYASGVAAGPNGMLYVTSRGAEPAVAPAVLEFNPNTDVFTTFATGPYAPGGIVFGPDGNLYVADNGSNDVFVYNPTNGALLNTIAALPGGEYVGGIAFGPNGSLTVGDFATGAIYNLPSTGTPTAPSFGPATQLDTTGGAIANLSGMLWHGDDLYVSSLGYSGAPGSVIDFSYNAALSSLLAVHSQTLPVPADVSGGTDSTYDASGSPSALVPDPTGNGFYIASLGPSEEYPLGAVLHLNYSDITNGVPATYFIQPYPGGNGIYAASGLAIVPEPSSCALAVLGAGALSLGRLRRRSKPARR